MKWSYFRISFGNWVIIILLGYIIYCINCSTPQIEIQTPHSALEYETISKFVAKSLNQNQLNPALIVTNAYPIGNIPGLYLFYTYRDDGINPKEYGIYVVDYTGYRYTPDGIAPLRFSGGIAFSEPEFILAQNQLLVNIDVYSQGKFQQTRQIDLTPYVEIYSASENAKNLLNGTR